LLKLSSDGFDFLVREHPEIRSFFEKRIERHHELHFLKTLDILSSLTPKETENLLDSIETVNIKKDEFLFHEGDPGEAVYIIREGSIRITKESAGNALLNKLNPGALIGEISLLQNQPRAASAIAIDDAKLLLIKREIFKQITSKSKKTQEIITNQARRYLLQGEALLSDSEISEGEKKGDYKISIKQIKAGKGLFARSFPFARAETPLLAGIACLSMINSFYRRENKLQPCIERQLYERKPDTLDTLNRKAEFLGYITTLLRLDEESLAKPAYPAIVEGEEGRLSVIFSVSETDVVLADPLEGIVKIPRKTFAKTWNKQLLTVTYVPDFGSVGKDTKNLYKQFLPMSRPYWDMVGAIVLVTLTIQLFGLAAPLFSKIIIDKVLVHGDYSLLYLMLIGMLFVASFQMAGNALRSFLVTNVIRRISASLLLRFFKHILSLPQKIFSKWKTGDLLLRFNDNEKVLQLVSQSGFKIIVDSFTVLFYLVILLTMNAKLTGAALIFVTAMALVMVISKPMLIANDRIIFKNHTVIESHIIETVTGIDTIKSLASEKLFFREGAEKLVKAKLSEFKGALLGFNIGLISTFIQQASAITILGYGAMLTLKGEITTGDLVAFNAMLGLLLAPLMGLIGVWDELQEVRVSFERLNDVLELPPEQQDEPAAAHEIKGHVRIENLSFSYDGNGNEVLSDINIEALPGQKIALVGRSGSGKTTLLNFLIRIYEPTKGKVFIDNRDISACVELSSLRRQFGVVEQNPYLFSGTIRDNISKADPAAGFERVVAAAALAGANEFIDELPMGYDTQIGERGMTLSGGQKQRLIIARAILTNPRILILDEATAALDTESEMVIQQNLDGLMKNRTTFIIAHRLSTVRNADQIVVLDEGRIAERGTHEQLIDKQGLYYYLNTQNKEG
jgi:ATP-binding cassette subfamily B protein